MKRDDDRPRGGSVRRGGKAWRWIVWSILLAAGVLVFVFQILLERVNPILRGRVIETLNTRFAGKVELDDLQVSIWHGLNVTGQGLRIYPPDDVVAAGANAPLIAVNKFEFQTGLLGLMFKPMHVETVHVRGLSIGIPPRRMRAKGVSGAPRLGKTKIEVDEIVCDDSRLVLQTDNPAKAPKVFDLKHIVLHDVGPNAPWPYDATLTNAVPKGDIHATGAFGPWNTESPGDSGITGKYGFEHADLSTIEGLGGILHSTGSFEGQLDRIAVAGTAEVPNFSLDTAKHPMPLWTRFSAVVDGTSGDTSLQPVEARLARSSFICRGTVVNVKGKGHIIDLDVNVLAGRIQDFLQLGVKTEPPVMTGIMTMKTKLYIRPGKESVTRKLSMKGGFALREIHFTNVAVEDKLDMLSLRAQGRPKEAKPGAPDVQSRMNGKFEMSEGQMRFSDLDYTLPGASINLTGVYTLDGQQFEFTGKVRTQAKLSQMVASRWKSWLLKLVDPFFRKNGAGAEIPVKVSGTKSEPHIGLNFGGDSK